MCRAEVQPWEEVQRTYRQHLEHIDLWSFVVAVDEKTKEILCLPSRAEIFCGQLSLPTCVWPASDVAL